MKNTGKKRYFSHVLKDMCAIYFGAMCALLPISVGHSEPLRAPVATGLPRLGEAGALDLTAERELGDRIAQQIYRDPDYMDDPVLVGYLDAIWQPLLAAAPTSKPAKSSRLVTSSRSKQLTIADWSRWTPSQFQTLRLLLPRSDRR